MSEEILRALMQLFAIIAKQDEGVESNEREYVVNFLMQQVNDEAVEEYIKLFDQHAGLNEEKEDGADEEDGQPKKVKLTSVRPETFQSIEHLGSVNFFRRRQRTPVR